MSSMNREGDNMYMCYNGKGGGGLYIYKPTVNKNNFFKNYECT